MKMRWKAGVAFLVAMAMIVVMAKFLHLTGPKLYLFIGLMGALGLTATGLFLYLFNRKKQGAQGAPAGGAGASGGAANVPEVEQLMREADARLAQSKAAGGANLASIPLVLVIGDRGTAKTSTLLQSGIEPELLAGQVYQDNNVAPTRAANIWFARGEAFVEAGGELLGQPAEWVRLIKHLQPGKLKSLVGSGGQAPRAVVVCFDLENFTRAGAAESIAAATRYLQGRLGDISQQLGINFPVYALFTRGDRLPYFQDFVHPLSHEESSQVFGVTLPVRTTTGIYAEEETRRLTTAFNNLFYSLCDKRLHLLPRESDFQKVPGSYEFPREFRKLRSALVQFLVDLCRPSQLRASPFLRGFYFSGVRPVEVSDAAPVAPQPQQQVFEPGSGATRMFRVGMEAQRAAQQATAQGEGGGTRRVPQWLFIGHLFHNILYEDRVAMGASGSSVKTSGLRRILLGLASLLLVFYSGALIVSFIGNHRLEQSALTAAENIPKAEAAGGAVPSQDALQRLDSLRAVLAELTDYEYNGAPLRLRWGLYAGSKIYPSVRRLYYDRFAQLLFGTTQANLLAFLQRTPAAPGPTDDYGYAYDTLKAYLLTTSEYKRAEDPSLQTFLGSRLLARWSAGRETDIGKGRMDLAKAQFNFYSSDLPHGNPYSSTTDNETVQHARVYLSKFSGYERVYQFLLSEAAKKGQTVSFNQKFTGSAEAVASTYEVPFAYTKDGWKFIQDAIKKANFGGEEWVLGPYQSQNVDKGAMARGILDLYSKDYINTWRTVLKRSSVLRYGDLKDASRKLNILTSNRAPLLALFWWTSQNTGIDLPQVSDAFKSVHMVVPPSDTQQYIVPTDQGYNNGLLKLQQSVDQAATANNPEALKATKDDASAAKLTEKQLSNTFPIDVDAHLETTVDALLLQPITHLDGLGPNPNPAGRAFCTAFDPLTRKFPFTPTAQPEVTLQELGDILHPKNGKLWQFYDSTVKNYLVCQGNDCQPNPSAPGQLNPGFVNFFKQMVRFSRALYGENGTDPSFKFTLRAQKSDLVQAFDVTLNSDRAELTGGAQKAYVWPGTTPYAFRLTVKVAGGSQIEVQSWSGPWAVFRFFADADRSGQSGGLYTFLWVARSGRSGSQMMIGGKPLTYEFGVDAGGAPAVFSKDFLSTLKCVSTVAR